MPIHFTVTPAQGVVLTTALGLVSGREVLEHVEAKTQAQLIHYDEIFDARNVTLDLSSSDLIAIAKAVRESLRGKMPGKSAVVTDSPIIYSLAKTYVELTGKETSDLHVFTDMPSAREWIGLTEDAFESLERASARNQGFGERVRTEAKNAVQT